jgi:hypothetical protein
MPAAKTKAKEVSVAQFIDNVTDAAQRSDARALLELMQTVTKAEPKLWSGSIIGFGTRHYVDTHGRQGDWCLVGFSPRKGLTLYAFGGWEAQAGLLAKLGPHSLRQELLSIKRLDDVNGPVLKRLIAAGFKSAQKLAKDEAKH